MLHIDTAAANRPYIVRTTTITTSSTPSPLTDDFQPNTSPEDAPLLSSFVGGNSNGNTHGHSLVIHHSHVDAPPSYLEATTPNLWTGRHSNGDEAAGLLSYDGQRGTRTLGADQLSGPLDGMYKGL